MCVLWNTTAVCTSMCVYVCIRVYSVQISDENWFEWHRHRTCVSKLRLNGENVLVIESAGVCVIVCVCWCVVVHAFGIVYICCFVKMKLRTVYVNVVYAFVFNFLTSAHHHPYFNNFFSFIFFFNFFPFFPIFSKLKVAHAFYQTTIWLYHLSPPFTYPSYQRVCWGWSVVVFEG